MTRPRIVIVGGGVTGLSLAVTLLDEAERLETPLDVRVLERGPHPGGHARTIRADGFVVETGPNGFLNREPETLALVTRLGLEGRVITANPQAARRYILRDGRLCRVPDSPASLLTTPALSWRGKLRMLVEPWATGPPGTDETVFDFAARRIGREAADVLVDTAVSGISAGDSRRLSVAAQFPMMVEMEREHGSLIRAMFARKRSPAGPSRLLGFDQGMSVLVDAMAARIGSALQCGTAVRSIVRTGTGWRVALDDGRELPADHVVLASPARVSATLVADTDAALAAALADVRYAGLTVVALGYDTADVPHALDGYGYLVTRPEGLVTLGVVWESSLFAGRAPRNRVLVRAMLGGMRAPEVAHLPPDECLGLARAELGDVLGVRAAPVYASVIQWPHAIAQYTPGHLGRMQRLRALLADRPGLHVCGTSYDGVSFNHAIKSGRQTARLLVQQLQDRRDFTPADARTA